MGCQPCNAVTARLVTWLYNRLNQTEHPMLAELPEQGTTMQRQPHGEEVREQLSRLLANPYFSHSKRFPTFLQFVIEQTLAGEADNIKERTLGIEIFGRDADYDTASDPIVRVTAAGIRKRVAQYYQDPAHVNEMRIALPSGSYIPKFYWPKGANDPVLKEFDLATEEAPVPSEAHPASPAAQTHRH